MDRAANQAEIEVTPEMVEAGVESWIRWNEDSDFRQNGL
jgi:hypothetical protein